MKNRSCPPGLLPVLIADPDDRCRELLASGLVKKGHSVRLCAGAEEARMAVRSGPFLAAVVELRLEESAGGLGLIAELRSHQPGLRVVVVTAYGSIPIALQALRLGASDFLTKPADPARVMASVLGEATAADPVRTALPSLDWVEWQHLHLALTECRGNITHTARVLGIDRRSLQRKLSRYAPAR